MKTENIKKVERFILEEENNFPFIKKYDKEELLNLLVSFYNGDLCFRDKQSEEELGSRLEMFLDVEYRCFTGDWEEDVGEDIRNFSIDTCDLLKQISQVEYPNNVNIWEHGQS